MKVSNETGYRMFKGRYASKVEIVLQAGQESSLNMYIKVKHGEHIM
jgi:hypothetical protein